MIGPHPYQAGRYAEVRALSRGIALLTQLNRLGEARAAVLARAAGLDRTTAYRLLATLEGLGLVTRRSADESYVLAPAIRSLSEGYVERDHITRSVSRHLGALFPKVLWPTDFATFERDVMVIRETTHRFSPYSVHRSMIGRSRPLLSSALGRAYLAGATPHQREAVVELARQTPGETLGLLSSVFLDEALAGLCRDFSEHGYSWSIGGTEPHIAAIALPIRGNDGAYGAVNLLFFRTAMEVPEAARRYLEPLRQCVASIEADLAADGYVTSMP